MANFNGMTISERIVKDSRIYIKTALFGLFKKYYYASTNSKIKGIKMEFSPSDGIKIEHALSNKEKAVSLIYEIGKLNTTPLGNYLLEIGLSEDKQFIAIMLFQFKMLNYEPVSDVCIFEGDEAKKIAEIL